MESQIGIEELSFGKSTTNSLYQGEKKLSTFIGKSLHRLISIECSFL